MHGLPLVRLFHSASSCSPQSAVLRWALQAFVSVAFLLTGLLLLLLLRVFPQILLPFLVSVLEQMPNAKGYRARTRHLFSKAFRHHGPTHLSTYLTTFKLGEKVDIKGDGSVQKGMPHKFYHGKTGTVWNITPRAIGVEVNKRVRHRIICKRIHVRIEHVKKSKSTEAFVARVKRNEQLKAEAKKNGTFVQLKRQPAQPRAGAIVSTRKTEIVDLAPQPYELLA